MCIKFLPFFEIPESLLVGERPPNREKIEQGNEKREEKKESRRVSNVFGYIVAMPQRLSFIPNQNF